MNKCKNCSTDFKIEDSDKAFYKKLDVPEPTFCPQCRSQRRLSWRNERNLYKRKCDLSGKDIISAYVPDSPFTVYSPESWHSDNWDSLEYSQEFDFNRPFFDQYADLQKKVPRISLAVANNENCPYVNQIWYCKNSYLCFDAGFCEDALFCDATYHSKNVVDCSFIRNCELLYWCVDCTKCFNSIFLQNCNNCSDAFFSFDCGSCQNIAFCYNLRNKKNHVFNKPISEEYFKQVMSDIKSGSYKKWMEYIKVFHEKVLLSAVHKENNNINTENCLGDYMQNSRNCQYCYDVDASEDLRYVNRMDEKGLTCMDIDNCSILELGYEGAAVSGNNIRFCNASYHPTNSNLLYCDISMSSSNCFGCISNKHKKYCILNKQYSQQEYEKLVPKIIEHMKTTNEWGEFFPTALSPYAYNETVANEYFPMPKEQVIEKGFTWRDPDQKDYQKQTFNLPDNLNEISDKILNEILACTTCGKNYKITSHELKFYHQFNLPIPRKCNDCRHNDRIVLRNPRKLFDRKCSKCQSDIYTTYTPDRPEVVYCEKCYLKEVY